MVSWSHGWSGGWICLAFVEFYVVDAVGNSLAEELVHLVEVSFQHLLLTLDGVVRYHEVHEELRHEVDCSTSQQQGRPPQH